MDVIKTDDLENYYLSEQAVNFVAENGGDSVKLLDRFVSNEADIKKSHADALNPTHAAISLDGEPTLYPFIGEYVSGFRSRKMTTFIVTNGTNPDVLQHMDDNGTLPTQLYITLAAPNKKIYQETCRPLIKDNWDKIQKSLELLPSLKTRTCIRITSVKNLNISDDYIDDYIKLIMKSQPNFVDIKGFTLEGLAMKISKRMNSPKHGSYYFPDFDFLMNFAKALEERGDFEILETHKKSRDILLRVSWPKNSNIKIQNNEI
jgi:tRNA wybutosine-synthesizing protein 1